jgi:hypothetical protein
MKKLYSTPELDIIKIKAEEILTDSNDFNLDEDEDSEWLN